MTWHAETERDVVEIAAIGPIQTEITVPTGEGEAAGILRWFWQTRSPDNLMGQTHTGQSQANYSDRSNMSI